MYNRTGCREVCEAEAPGNPDGLGWTDSRAERWREAENRVLRCHTLRGLWERGRPPAGYCSGGEHGWVGCRCNHLGRGHRPERAKSTETRGADEVALLCLREPQVLLQK